MEVAYLLEQLTGLRQQALNLSRQIGDLRDAVVREASEQEEAEDTSRRRTFGQKEREDG
jgi:hypothetical protein